MRHTLALALIASACCAGSVAAQTDDPYAAGIAATRKDRLQKDYNEYLDGARMLYFAVGCKAILVEPYAALALANRMPDFLSRGIPKAQIETQIRAAARDGLAKAQEGCQVWKDAPPEVISSLREMVRAGVMP
jgi:hypothetical protein